MKSGILRVLLVFGVCTIPAAARADRCVLHGNASIEDVIVTIEGERPVTLDIHETSMEVGVPDRGQPAPVRVSGPMAFEGSTRAAIPYVVARPTSAEEGRIQLGPHVRLSNVRPDGDGLRVDAELARGVFVRGVPLRCEQLAVGAIHPAVPPQHANGPTRVMARGRRLRVHERPDETSKSVMVDIARPRDAAMQETGRQDGWVEVFQSFMSGGGFTGWVRASEVRAAPARLPERPLAVTLETEAERVPMCVREPIRGYNGPATVARGTEVRSRPEEGGAVWARVPEQTRLVVEDAEGEWVAVVGVDGLRGRAWCPLLIERAWVPRESVRMPSTTAETLLPSPEQRAEAQARPIVPEPPTIDLPIDID